MRRVFLKIATTIFLLAALSAVPAMASGVLTGTVSGIILDKTSNQPLAGAEVFLTNMRTGAARRTISDATGAYVFSQVYPPGIYSITIQLAGYRTVESTNLSVAINDTATPVPPISLERATGAGGTLTQEAKSAVVNVADSMRKMVLDPQALRTLPVSGVRTFDRLALLAPGVYEVPASGGTGPGVGPGVGTGGQFAVNGQRGRANSFLVDGSDNNDQDVGVRRQGFVALVPQSMESVENYQIITSNYPAEFGRSSGAVANAVSKSGENTVHGTLYGYHTNQSLMARNFFDQTDGPTPHESPYKRSQYGLAIGGPLKKDSTFMFFSFESQVIKDYPEKHFSVPTLDQRGFFGVSPLLDSNDDGIDDLTSSFFSEGIALFGLSGRAIWNLVPLPNNPIGPYGANTYTQQLNADGSGRVASFKLDHRIGENHNFTVRYNFTDDDVVIPVTGGGINSSIKPDSRTQNLSLFLNSVLGTNAANQFRASYGRTRLNFGEVPGSPLLFGTNDVQQVLAIYSGLPDIYKQMFTTPIKTDFGKGTYGPFGTTGALGQLMIHPYSPMGVDVYNFPQARTNNTFQYADTYTRQIKSHILKAGIDLRRGQQNSRLDRNGRALAEFAGGYSPTIAGAQVNDGFVRGADIASIGFASTFLQTLIPDFDGNNLPDFDTNIGLDRLPYR